ncbi:MAG: tetraacyldisaccharide 4'-kinase [Aestuariivita sp.]|nr:tetraacyldisaccharide 4'-kinase [Aestuariivita sp.]MCY4347909.1 tetraacyldisaccharide 4'-kinase [Aestuariivita sp.]
MRPPRFWNRPPGDLAWQSKLLAPLGVLYGYLVARRLAHGSPTRMALPVICVGNINVGGVGKTPAVIWLAERLAAAGHTPHVISTGYGGSLAGPVPVNPKIHRVDQVGDEPLLIAAFSEVWVAKNRVAAARSAQAAGATALILDDGHQDPSLVKDISIVVVDSALGFGNQCCLPAGPLREPVEVGLARADLVLKVGSSLTHKLQENIPQTIPSFAAELHALDTGMDWSKARVIAFAGIGNPEKFFATIRRLGGHIIHTEALDDHQPLSETLLSRLLSQAKKLNAQLVTTEKDAVRLPKKFRSRVITVPVRLRVDDEKRFQDLLVSIAPALKQ